MRKVLFTIGFFVSFFVFSCKKEDKQEHKQEQVSPETLAKIKTLGFSDKNVIKMDSGYLVENDIFISENDLNKTPDRLSIRVGTEEHYRTNNVITSGLPRTIQIYVSSELPEFYKTAVDIVITRYNSLNLLLTFQRTTNPLGVANKIHVWDWDNPVNGIWASSGTPAGTSEPYHYVLMNEGFIGTSPDLNFLASVIAHEIGHCIGFRHTDYMNRSYSCGGASFDEGDGGVGAVHIPGTPTTADPDSWMLACISYGQNRPFTANDAIALQFVY